MARFLIVLGLVILVVGLLWPYLSRIVLGRLPGDIVIERDNVTFYSPIDVVAAEPAVQRRFLGGESLNRAVSAMSLRALDSRCSREAGPVVGIG
jgi:DUF2905 family protein